MKIKGVNKLATSRLQKIFPTIQAKTLPNNPKYNPLFNLSFPNLYFLYALTSNENKSHNKDANPNKPVVEATIK